MFKGDRIQHLSDQAKKSVGIEKNVNLKLDDDKINSVLQEYEILRDLCKKQDFDKVCKIILALASQTSIKDLYEKSFRYLNFFKTLELDISIKKIYHKSKNIDSIFENSICTNRMKKKKQLKNIMKWKNFFQIVLILKKDLITHS